MNLGEIIKDSVAYPTNNIQALLIYLILGFFAGLIMILTGIGGFVSGNFEFKSSLVAGIFGIVVVIFLILLMCGFSLDIIKFGINRKPDAPSVDFSRQISNGIKYFIVTFAYLIIPFLVTAVLAFSLGGHWAVYLIGFVLHLVFTFILAMAICRLAETDELSHALDFKGVLGDLRQIGIGRVVITLIVSEIVGFVIVFIITFLVVIILSIINSDAITSLIVPIFSSIIDAWLLFYLNRVMGLLYSNK